ncbi:hypothetical protein DC498_10980 [Terrimonas sp.]|uniref:hypothetical protein n=1 Tax=Terrimonas sp. TaxID=1914338 RepID=UPI000D522695|nr:hypothetical protein [Terrimonas sp.]PVD52239.1 hypothetical protein DC498_10980 [Terrimonas sp.]
MSHRHTQIILADIFLLTALPVLSVIAEHQFHHTDVNTILVGRWFIFWTVGIRLLVAGFTQVITAHRQGNTILLRGDPNGDTRKIIGLVKILLAGLGFLCMINNEWSLLAAITVGLYIGLAGFQHDFKKPITWEDWIYMIYDLLVFLMITCCLVF